MRFAKATFLAVAILLASTHLMWGAALLWLNHTEQKIIVVTGGSMSPTFEVGDAILVARDPNSMKVHDIVTFKSNQGFTTHRILAFHTIKGEEYIQTQGDANEEPDPDFTPKAAVVGVVHDSYPHLGFALNFLSSQRGLILTLSPILLFIVFSEGRDALTVWREEPAGEAPKPKSHKRGD